MSDADSHGSQIFDADDPLEDAHEGLHLGGLGLILIVRRAEGGLVVPEARDIPGIASLGGRGIAGRARMC